MREPNARDGRHGVETDGNASEAGVLVLDSDTQAALCVVRSLGKRNVSVTAGDASERSLGMLSRYSDASYVHPDPDEGPERFVRRLREHLAAREYDAVIPVMDGTTALLARRQDSLERTGTTVACEDWETFATAYDKARLFEAVESVDVPCPETVAPPSVAAVDDLATDVSYPAVVKPRSKSVWTDDGHALRLVGDENYVASPAELRSTYRRIVADREYPDGRYPIVQEYVPGTTACAVGIAADGDVATQFQEERLRTYPDSGGNSALLGAVREPRMREHAERVVERLGWTGPFMVEFMRTPDDEFYLIEVNGRYWGSVPFAVTCGVDVPWLHYRQLRDDDLSAAADGDYRTDVVQRRLLYEDCKWIGEQLAEGNVATLGPFLESFLTARHTFVYPDDPAPTVAALAQAAALATREVGRRARRLPDRLPPERGPVSAGDHST